MKYLYLAAVAFIFQLSAASPLPQAVDPVLGTQAPTLTAIADVATIPSISLPDSGRFGPVSGECADAVDFLCE